MNTGEPLDILARLGDELARATAADEQRRPSAAWRHWWTGRLPLVALMLGLTATGVAAAATHLFGLAAPIPAPRAADAPANARIVPGTAALAGLRTADPDGLPAWDVRVSRSRAGGRCTAVGQVVDGQFGLIGLDRRFRRLEPGAADVCGLPPVGTQVQVGARAALGGSAGLAARTLVVGLAGPSIRRIVLDHGGQLTQLRLGRDRAFLGVLAGLPTDSQPVVRATDRAGRTRTFDLAGASLEQAADPGGGEPWLIDQGPVREHVHPMLRGYRHPPAGAECVAARQANDPRAVDDPGRWFPGGAITPTACRLRGNDAPVVVTMRRLTPSLTAPGIDAYVYGLAPSRTIAMGLARADVERAELRTPSGAIPVHLTAGHAFLVVLDGHVDPARLAVRARLRDGRLITQAVDNAALIGAAGNVYQLRRDPPWADVTAVRARAERSRQPQVVAGSTQIGPRVSDPAGGPSWAARVWLADGVDQFSKDRPIVRKICATYGPVVDGVVRRARGAGVGSGAAEPTTSLWSGCVNANLRPARSRRDRRSNAAAVFTYATNPQVYVDDPESAAPKIARVVLSAVYPGAVSGTVIGLPQGRQVPAAVGPHGALLALLPAAAAEHTNRLRIRLRFADGLIRTTSYMGVPFARPPAARAVDPKGGAAWEVHPASLRMPWIPSMAGQIIVGGRPGRIDDRSGVVSYWSGVSGGLFRPTARRPVTFVIEVQPDSGDLEHPSPADVARRTLPGRTIITGAAAPGVTRVTIHTPRDVRTLRPSKVGGLFIAVYDGHFTRGSITVVADGPGIHGLQQRPADPYR